MRPPSRECESQQEKIVKLLDMHQQNKISMAAIETRLNTGKGYIWALKNGKVKNIDPQLLENWETELKKLCANPAKASKVVKAVKVSSKIEPPQAMERQPEQERTPETAINKLYDQTQTIGAERIEAVLAELILCLLEASIKKITKELKINEQ